jgi:hypothetical protein
MYTAKTVAYAVIFGNCIGFFLWSSVIALASNVEQPKIDVNETGSITGIKVPYQGKEPKTNSVPVLDYIIGLWFVFSTAWALWVLLNPLIS